jgi:hypothetical protein
MPGFDQEVYNNRCVLKNATNFDPVIGHSIVAMQVGIQVDPVTKTIIPDYEALCSACGMSLEEIRQHSEPPKKKRAPRKPKGTPDEASA